MSRNESETRTQLIDPALHRRGWTGDLVKHEVTAGTIEVVGGRAMQASRGRMDYVLRIKVNPDTQPVAVALIEAKAEHLLPGHGLEQGKAYTAGRRMHVPFVFASNGHLFVEYDGFTGQTSDPRPLDEFPTPDELRSRYERGLGFNLTDEAARPLLARYARGEAGRRYYQDAAIRAVLEGIAQGRRKALLSVATGAGKTFIAVHLLRRIADAGQLRKALFVCDRDELRTQAWAAFQNVFGADAAVAFRTPEGRNNAQNARVHVVTYQTLGVDREEADASFLEEFYPPGYFSHVVIDECHRSAFGKWFEILRRNPDAVQVGLTATPRRLEFPENTPEAEADERLRADNLRYFGDPVYEYEMGQGIEDGYLAACEVVRRDVFIEDLSRSERERGVLRADLEGKRLTDARTGRAMQAREARARYDASRLDARLVTPDRVRAMTEDLFEFLLATGGPEQKTIIFCASDNHAGDVANALNGLYARWSLAQGRPRAEPYAFKCTSAANGSETVADLRGAQRHHFVATTVDLLTTGVDVPPVRNVVFFKYVGSPIAFYQMVGRGTRLDMASGKLMFRVYDYTDATRLFGTLDSFRFRPVPEPQEPRSGGGERPEPEAVLRVEGLDVHVGDAGRFVVSRVDGRESMLTLEEYRERLVEALVQRVHTLDEFREAWIAPAERRLLMSELPEGGRSASLIRTLNEMDDFDLYDVLAEMAFGSAARTRPQRGNAFASSQGGWLSGMPNHAAATLRALVTQFVRSGTEGLESPQVFNVPAVVKAGGVDALRALGKPAEVLRETKSRLFAA